jgi:type IV pilus assembly protein PilY1
MKDIGSQEPYDPSIDYATLLDLSSSDAYESGRVYLRNVANENNTNYQTTKFTVDEVGCSRLTDQSGNYAEEAYDGSYATDFPNGDGYDDGTNEIHPRYALEQRFLVWSAGLQRLLSQQPESMGELFFRKFSQLSPEYL